MLWSQISPGESCELAIGFSACFLTEEAHIKEFKVMKLLMALQLDLLASREMDFTVGVNSSRCSRSLDGDLLSLSPPFRPQHSFGTLCCLHLKATILSQLALKPP